MPSTQEDDNGLVTFVTEENEIRTVVPKIPISRDLNPWGPQTPFGIVTREYAVGNFTFTSAGVKTATAVQPFLDQDAFSSAIKTFRYLKWKSLNWRFQVMAVPQVYGGIAFTCCPLDERRLLSVNDYGLLSHTDTVWCDFSTMNSGRITVPWLFNNTWADKVYKDRVKTSVSTMTDLKMVCQNIYSNSSDIPQEIVVNVWCSLSGVEVAGPTEPADWKGPSALTKKKKAQMQSGTLASALFDTLSSEAQKYLATNGMDYVKQSAKKGFNALDDMMGDYFDFDNPSESSTPAAAPSTDVIPNIWGNMNYSKPKHLVGTGSMVLPVGSHGKHSLLNTLALPWLESYLTVPADPNVSVTIDTWPFTQNPAVSYPDGSLISNVCSRLDFFSRFFRFWKGSTVVTLMFFSSPLVVQKVQITLSYNPDDPSLVGNQISRVVTIKGTTIESFTIPYLFTVPYKTVDTTSSDIVDLVPKLSVRLVAPARSAGDIVPALPCVVYRHAGNDFRFYSQREPQFQTDAAEMQASVSSFKRMTSGFEFDVGLVPDTHTSDAEMYIEDMAKRWCTSPGGYVNVLRPLAGYMYGVWSSNADCLRSLFFYNRGTYKIRATFDATNLDMSTGLCVKMDPASTFRYPGGPGSFQPIPTEHRYCDGIVVVSYGLTQLLEFTVPFLCELEWLPVYTDASVGILSIPVDFSMFGLDSTVTPGIKSSAAAPGDDFALSLMLPPPVASRRWYVRNWPSTSLDVVSRSKSVSESFSELTVSASH